MKKENINQVIYLFIIISIFSYLFFYIFVYKLNEELKNTGYEYAYHLDQIDCNIKTSKYEECLYIKEHKKNDKEYQKKKTTLVKESKINMFRILSPKKTLNQYVDISAKQLRFVLDKSLYEYKIKKNKDIDLEKIEKLEKRYNNLIKDTVKYGKIEMDNIYNLFFNPFYHFLYSLFLIVFYKTFKYCLKIKI